MKIHSDNKMFDFYHVFNFARISLEFFLMTDFDKIFYEYKFCIDANSIKLTIIYL